MTGLATRRGRRAAGARERTGLRRARGPRAGCLRSAAARFRRAWTRSALQQLFAADPGHLADHGLQLLDALERGGDVLLERAMREQHDVDQPLALAGLLLHHGVDRDLPLRQD